ncbi:MAG: Ppx/GppA phosphatase family protein [Acidimicrobiales bacterium]
MPRPRRLAAIDIGTSSVHLAIAQPVPGGRPEILLREKLPVRLGSGAKDMKSLDPAAIDRAIEALVTFRALADANDAEIYAVATSAVREADDPSILLERARAEAGIDIEVISGIEEARLIHLGVLGAVPLTDQTHLVIDVGGGSTELIVGRGTEPKLMRSLKLGHVRLKDRFFPDGVVTEERIGECRRYIRSFLARVAITVSDEKIAIVAGCSGTFETLVAVARSDHRGAERRQQVRRSEIDTAVERILGAETSEERREIRGLDEHRVDTAPAGAILVQTLMESLGFDRFVLSPDALREGLVLDRLDARDPNAEALLHLNEIRANSVRWVAQRYGENLLHAQQATDIALQLFEATASVHDLGEFERNILEAAGVLHNIGRFVGHGAHHKHSYYLIRNSEHLAGFNEHELELIAQVARYHRKSEPKRSHRDWSALPPADQKIVATLAGMLRIGIALDRTYRNLATDLEIECADDTVTIAVMGDPDELELELFAANERRGLLERSLDRRVSIHAGMRP